MAAVLLFGCTSDNLGGATGTGGAVGGAGGTGAAGSAGTMASGGAGGTMVTGGAAGTGGRYLFCTYPDSTRCTPNTTCGNGVRDTCAGPWAGTGIDCDNPFTEWCDGDDLGTATCASRGLGSGTLRCTSDCGFDTSGCSGAPGGSGGASAATARP